MTFVLLTIDFLLCSEDFQAAVCRGCSRAPTSCSPGLGLGDRQIAKYPSRAAVTSLELGHMNGDSALIVLQAMGLIVKLCLG